MAARCGPPFFCLQWFFVRSAPCVGVCGVIISEVEGKVFLRGKALYCKDIKAVETLIKGIKRGWGRRNILTVR